MCSTLLFNSIPGEFVLKLGLQDIISLKTWNCAFNNTITMRHISSKLAMSMLLVRPNHVLKAYPKTTVECQMVW